MQHRQISRHQSQVVQPNGECAHHCRTSQRDSGAVPAVMTTMIMLQRTAMAGLNGHVRAAVSNTKNHGRREVRETRPRLQGVWRWMSTRECWCTRQWRRTWAASTTLRLTPRRDRATPQRSQPVVVVSFTFVPSAGFTFSAVWQVSVWCCAGFGCFSGICLVACRGSLRLPSGCNVSPQAPTPRHQQPGTILCMMQKH